jgi:hypothetical protein
LTTARFDRIRKERLVLGTAVLRLQAQHDKFVTALNDLGEPCINSKQITDPEVKIQLWTMSFHCNHRVQDVILIMIYEQENLSKCFSLQGDLTKCFTLSELYNT